MSEKLGNSGLPVSRLGIGLAALGRPGYITLGHSDDLDDDYSIESMQAHASQVLDVAWKNGIRYFDTTRSYGLAEQFLGYWLTERHFTPAILTVGSKWGYTYTAHWQTQAAIHEVKDLSLSVLQRQIKESRGYLNNFLKLYQIHSATLDSGVFENVAVLNELARLKDQGLAIGLTLSGPNQADTLRYARKIRVDGKPLFDTVQVTWNLFERSTTPVLAEAHAAGLGIIVKEALANGLLTDRNHDPAFADQMMLLHQQADRLYTTIDALALAAVLAQPWANVILSGAATVSQLESNIAARTIQWDTEAESVLSILAQSPESYWDRRKRLAWN